MTFVLQGYTVEEIFDTTYYDIATVSVSAIRYALRTNTIIWVL